MNPQLHAIKNPHLRFLEFNQQWQEKSLGDIATFHKGNGISKEDISEEGKYSCIRYGELYTTYGEVIKNIKSKTNVNNLSSVKSMIDDLLIPSSGETELDIAKTSCLKVSDVLLGGDINVLRINGHCGEFYAYYLSNCKKKDIAKLAQGNAVVHLYSSHLKSVKVKFPSLQEQQKIASFLSSIDEWIENLRLQKESLEKYKKGMMHKIFSQQIRFKDENGKDFPDWKIKYLHEVLVRKSERNRDNKIKHVLSNSAVSGIINQRDFFEKDIANQNNLLNYFKVDVDDFVYNPRISNEAPYGPFNRNKLIQGIMSPLYTVLKLKDGNLDFFEMYFKTSIWHKYMYKIANYGARYDRLSFSQDDFMRMEVPFPTEQEQKKIAIILNAIEEMVFLKNKQIKLAEQWKKGLMQKMFI